MNDRCRKEFEARFEHLELTRITDSGGYNSKITNRTWIGFKAAWQAARKVDIEKGAKAIKDALGKALNAKPLLGDKESGDWYADGGSLNLMDLSQACADAWGLDYEWKKNG